MAKVTAAEMEVRMTMIVQLLLQGANTSQIIKFCSDKWQLKKRTVDNYIATSRLKISELADKDREFRISQALLRYDELYQKSLKDKDWRECRNIQGAVNTLIGLNAPVKQDHTTKGESLNKGFYEFLKLSSREEVKESENG